MLWYFGRVSGARVGISFARANWQVLGKGVFRCLQERGQFCPFLHRSLHNVMIWGVKKEGVGVFCSRGFVWGEGCFGSDLAFGGGVSL